MPHFRSRQTNRGSWSVEDLERAIRAVGEGMGIRKSARNFGNNFFKNA